MKYLGYSNVGGSWAGKPADVKPWTNLYVAWADYGYWTTGLTPAQWRAKMAAGVKKAVDLGQNIYLCLNGQAEVDMTSASINAVLDLMQPYWNHVVAVDVADEPAWTKQQLKANLVKVRKLIATKGLPSKPCGVTLTTYQSTQVTMTPSDMLITAGGAAGPDFFTLECYVDRFTQDKGQKRNLAEVTEFIVGSRDNAPVTAKFWYWLQGFNRNGAFPNEDNLAALIFPSYKLGRDDPRGRTDGYLFFNWGRQTGVGKVVSLWLPKVTAQTKRVWADMQARGGV